MQTFLPYQDFKESARSLDYRRLGKQRVEVLQLLNSFNRPGYKGWKNHPAREMWRGHENALVMYGQAICNEWISRGYKDTCFGKITLCYNSNSNSELPSWIGDSAIHISHQSNLIRKQPSYYAPLWPGIPDDLPYVWPINLVKKNK